MKKPIKQGKKTIRLSIEANMGSNFQEFSARSSLMAMIKSWITFYLFRHKKNRFYLNGIEITIKNFSLIK